MRATVELADNLENCVVAFCRWCLCHEKPADFQMRLGPRLRVDWQIAPETSALLVPQMILQPLAENAIRHGIARSRSCRGARR